MAVFPSRHVAGFSLAALVACGVAVAASGDARPGEKTRLTKGESEMADHPYVGMWVTDDGHVRHELLANGRYEEARGKRESAYQGRYAVNGTRIDYWDDTGFTADGVFVDRNTLYHGGMILRRR